MEYGKDFFVMFRQIGTLKGKFAGVIMAAGLFAVCVAFSIPAVAGTTCTATKCTCNGGELLSGSNGQDLEINTATCFAKAKDTPFNYHNVNIYGGGELHFMDDGDIDFWAESILVEYKGSLTAGLPSASGAYKSRLTIHLWGKSSDPGIVCKSPLGSKQAPCGIPDELWIANTGMADHMNMGGTQSLKAKNAACNSIQGYDQYLPPVQGKDECFYQYEIQDLQDQQAKRQAFFGHKTVAVSFGGTLQLFGSVGTTYLTAPGTCAPATVGNECNPANTGTSWRRLVQVSEDKRTLTLNSPTGSAPVNWKNTDHIVVTTTDYLPSHSEEAILDQDATGKTIHLKTALTFPHNASVYPIPEDVPGDIGPQNDPNVPETDRAVDTRAAVALLTRNIQIVSAGDTYNAPFTETPGNYYGGHNIIRQGFASYQVQGVEFYLLGQGGAKGRYPVHFHMDRRIPQQTDPTQGALNFLKDSSIHESMTRWVTIHATQGMYLARNVGYRSIGHGFYFEDATEINNKLFANIGIMARAAIQNGQNPRMVPGILADTKTDGSDNDDMPYRSDFNHPTVFWMMNGWNDFEYNMAAGASTCGACYWFLPAAVSGPSQYEFWDGYASQNIYDPTGNGNCVPINNPPTQWTCSGNLSWAGQTPLKKFIGNSCVSAMSSFESVGNTSECIGVPAQGSGPLAAVPSVAPREPQPNTLFDVYYPGLTSNHSSTVCAGADDPTKSVQCGQTKGVIAPSCSTVTPGECAATVLDHYSTSFNWAQTNFAAIWLRPKWFLVSNTAVTDVQTGGIGFVTGGDYTRSSTPVGDWSLLKNSVMVGHTQSQGPDGNPFAYDSGPFNPTSGLHCDTLDPNRCQSGVQGLTFLLPPWPGQRLFTIYDGPAFQANNVYLNVSSTDITDCLVNGNGNCGQSNFPLARNQGVLVDAKAGKCYLPNAAIAWKQPNGFYYPPSFDSENLWFDNVDIRHFVVEPFFVFNPKDPNNPFSERQKDIADRYCTYTSPDNVGNGTQFINFTHVDRQTILNDTDGSLTGLLADDSTDKNDPYKPTISINEDTFFNSPKITPECLSDVGVEPNNPDKRVFTARTSPYEWVTTAMIADCAIETGEKSGNLLQCLDQQNRIQWGNNCGNPLCRGVPLFREDLTTLERSLSQPYPSIRMMGDGNGQRSTLSLNHGAYYIDTTQGCDSQGACPVCTLNPAGTDCMVCKPGTNDCWLPGHGNDIDPNPFAPSVFLGGHTYYVFLLFAKPSTTQTYDVYVGKNEEGKYTVTPQRMDLPGNNYGHRPDTNATWFSSSYQAATGTVHVTFDLSNQQMDFEKSQATFCQPGGYCQVNGTSCGCKPGSGCTDPSVCAWGQKELDCPLDPEDQTHTKMGCYGFAITMPADFQAPPQPMKPDVSLFHLFPDEPYFGKVGFDISKVKPSGGCVYSAPPQDNASKQPED
jgi:hypothetical protein